MGEIIDAAAVQRSKKAVGEQWRVKAAEKERREAVDALPVRRTKSLRLCHPPQPCVAIQKGTRVLRFANGRAGTRYMLEN